MTILIWSLVISGALSEFSPNLASFNFLALFSIHLNMKQNKQYGLSLKSATSSGENARKLEQQDALWV